MTVHTLCLTGGPCAGKSSALPLVKGVLEERGYTVAVVPEVATILLSNGFRLREVMASGNRERYLEMQAEITRVQLALENAQRTSLEAFSGPAVLLTDRGVLDNKAYVGIEQWDALQQQVQMTERRMLLRYDHVYHLVSAAEGAPDHYVQTEVRVGGLSIARNLEQRTQWAWAAHPNRTLFDNSTDFIGKMTRLVAKLHADFPIKERP